MKSLCLEFGQIEKVIFAELMILLYQYY